MDLHTVRSLLRPAAPDEVAGWAPGHAWLAGGTWLFSEPQPGTDTLVDLGGMGWAALTPGAEGLEIGATCTIADLAKFRAPEAWRAAPLFRACCDSFLASFKVWNSATVGGNLVMALPAGPMIALTAALDGVCTLWPREGGERTMPVMAFVTGNHANALRPGELLRSVHLPADTLHRRAAMRQMALTKLGRSGALVIGTIAQDGAFALTVTGATDRPVQVRLPAPEAPALLSALEAIPAARWFEDVHGAAAWKRHVALHLAEEIRAELAS